jgi:hypothetical protein
MRVVTKVIMKLELGCLYQMGTDSKSDGRNIVGFFSATRKRGDVADASL